MRGMRWLAILVLLGGVTAAPRVDAQRVDKATTLLESAKQAELVDGNLDAAIKLYQQIITTYPADRPVATAALLGLGHCYEKLGLPKARATYERLVEQYSDQTREVNEARARLARLTEDTSSRGEGGEVVLREVWSRSSGSVTNDIGNNGVVIFSDLSVHSPQTGQTKRLTDGARSAAYPVLSPNRQMVAYLSWSGDLQASLQQAQNNRAGLPARTELRIVGLDGKNDRAILSRRDVTWLRPLAWSRNADQILADFERRDGSHELATIAVEGGATRVLKSLDQRSPQDAGFSPDGQYVAYHLPSARDARQLDLYVVPVNPAANKTPTERRYTMTLGSELATLTPDRQQVIHVLNRLTFGPRPGDIDKVSTMGVDAFIDRQLHPERIPDPFVEAGLKNYTSLQMDLRESLEKGAPVAPQAMRGRASIFEKRALADRLEQKAAYSAEDNTIMPTTFAARKALLKGHPEPNEMASARLLRAIYSERQLFELVVDFWMNHFSIKLNDHQQAPHFEEQVIRRLALGKFEDLLLAVAKHPRMLNYLDNWRSSAPEEVVAARIAALKPTLNDQQYLALMARKPFLDQAKGLNENYARELMELHTLGVDGGYTQKDVIEVAKVLTGWTISNEGIYNGREDDGVFAFDPLLHVDGNKVVLGKTIEASGVSEGEQVLRMLAHHPSTARFIATKLARRFVADEPPAAVIDAAAKTFQQTGGDTREVLRTIFMSPQFRSPEAFRSKIKKPFEIVVSSFRAVKAETEGFISDPELGTLLLNNQRGILAGMGERLYNYEAPDGNPDVSAAWMNSNALLVRLDFANRLAIGSLPRIKPNLAEGQKLLDQLGLARPTPQQIATTRTMLLTARASADGAQADMMMTGNRGGPGATTKDIDPAAIVVAAMLGSPQFQKR